MQLAEGTTRSVQCRMRLLLILLAGLGALGQTGCSRSLRPQAAKVAKAGSLTAQQLGDYYDSLMEDELRGWELYAFRSATGTYRIVKAAQDAIDKIDAQLLTEHDAGTIAKLNADKATQKAVIEVRLKKQRDDLDKNEKDSEKIFDALSSRKSLAAEMQGLYDAFARLVDYDATADVEAKASSLINVVNTVAKTKFPSIEQDQSKDANGKTKSDIISGVITDVVRELTVVAQNRAILRQSKEIVPLLTNIRKLFDTERVVYKDVATQRAQLSTDLAKDLVDYGEVVSTGLVDDALATYGLKWPEPQTPFKAIALRKGVEAIITARSKPLLKASHVAADQISGTFGHLIALHAQLLIQKPLTFGEFLDSSAAVQISLNQLKARGVPAQGVLDFVKTMLKEK